MIANPQSPVFGKPAGGVAAVQLLSAANIREAEFSAGNTRCTCIALGFCDPQAVMQCRLLEERSSFVEKLTVDEGPAAVTHTLHLVADRNLAEAWLEPAFTAELMTRGAAAVVTLTDGRRVLAGVSRKFGLEQPLRLKLLKVDSGRRLADEPTVEMVLESVDTSFAAQLELD